MRDDRVGVILRPRSTLGTTGKCALHIPGDARPLGERGANGRTDALGSIGLAQVVEHHRGGENLGRGIGDVLARDIGRTAVRGLEDRRIRADIGTGLSFFTIIQFNELFSDE